jgi:hypothetical protein
MLRGKWFVFRSSTDFGEKPQGRAAVAAASPQRLGSLNRNAFFRDVAGYLKEEVAGRVVEIQGEGTALRIAAVTQSERFTEVDGPMKFPFVSYDHTRSASLKALRHTR